MSTSLPLSAAFGHAIKGLVASAIIGAGALMLNTAKVQAEHTVEIQQLQATTQKIDKLSDKLDETNKNLDRLIGRTEAADVARNGK